MLGPYPRVNPNPTESIFVYGREEPAISALAVGLALRHQGPFSWADCAISPTGASPKAQGLFAKGRSRPNGDGVHESDLAAHHWSAAAIERLLVPENRMDTLHLMSYLALPSLLQELAAMSTSPTGESSVLLANVDALDPRLRASVLGRAEIHARLRSAEVTLFVTCRGRPTRKERELFSRVLHVEVSPTAAWSEGSVFFEKGFGASGEAPSEPLRSAWSTLKLDPTLLPPP